MRAVPDLHVAPQPTGRGDGTSWEHAAALADLDALVASRPDGGRVLLRADEGPYRLSAAVSLSSGGQEGSPVVIQGVDAAGRPASALLLGERSVPYDVDGNKGEEVFRLGKGADHLEFRDLTCRDQGTCFRVHADIEDLLLEDIFAQNVRRFLESNGNDGTATISGLVARRIEVDGYSKGAFRLRDDSHDVLLVDVHGDSQRQDGDDFAMGVFLGGSVHDVVLRRVTMANSQDTRGEDDYWNGDGFATERGVSRILFEDTVASGSTDAGYDLKSTRTRLIRAVARDNKRNFRLWSSDAVLVDCRGDAPNKRGGTGAASQVWLAEDAEARLQGCTFDSSETGSPVFHVEEDARLVVEGGSVRRRDDAALFDAAEGAEVVLGPDVEEIVLP